MWMILEEMKSGDIDEIGRYVFASCWTDKILMMIRNYSQR